MTVAPVSGRIHSGVLHALDAVDAEHAAPGIEVTLTLIDSQTVTEVAELTDVTAHLLAPST